MAASRRLSALSTHVVRSAESELPPTIYTTEEGEEVTPRPHPTPLPTGAAACHPGAARLALLGICVAGHLPLTSCH